MINFSGKENLSDLIELEKISLISNLDIQKNLNKQILMFMKNFMASINFSSDISPADEGNSYLNELTSRLNTSNSNISILKTLIESLDMLNVSSKTIETDLQKYNETFKESFDSIFKNTDSIEKFLYKINISDDLISDLETSAENIPQSSAEYNNNFTNSVYEPNSDTHFVENTLIISETRGKVFLPYKLSTLQEIFSKNNDIYSSLTDVIDKVFTLPIDYYHFSPVARFKEAFKLVKYKEKGSKIKALALGFELFVNYNLHPAIITACSSLDELDIYLACLEENNLQDFHFFNIIYEIPLATYNPKHSL